jgi:hypothetical protein
MERAIAVPRVSARYERKCTGIHGVCCADPLCLAAQGDTGVLAEGPQPTAYTAITPEIYLRTRGTGIAQ